MGPKHGIARGVAMFTSPGPVSELTITPFETNRLRDWAHAHGVALTDDFESLDALDSDLDAWNADPSHYESVDLGNEVGLYVGNVIVHHVPGCRWRAWPNGHPVIRDGSHKDLDVIAMVHDRILWSGQSLQSIYSTATEGQNVVFYAVCVLLKVNEKMKLCGA